MFDRLTRAGFQRREFAGFVARTSDHLLRTAYQLTGDLGEAEDLVQDVYISMARHWDRIQFMDSPVAYARRSLVNLAFDGSNRRARRRSELAGDAIDEAADAGAGTALHWIDETAEIRWALSQLTPRQRAAIVFRYWLDLPEDEVAELLGCSVGTVKSTTSRAVLRIRAFMHRPDAEGSAVEFEQAITLAERVDRRTS